MANSKFFELIKDARIEKDVEHVYTTGINMYFPDTVIEHPFACDSFIDTKFDGHMHFKVKGEAEVAQEEREEIVNKLNELKQ